MPPRISSSTISRPLTRLAYRPLPTTNTSSTIPSTQQWRSITAKDRPLPTQDKPGEPGLNEEQLPHVSEEARAVSQIMGQQGPEIEQGTPVQEVLARDPKQLKNAPKVLQEEVKKEAEKRAKEAAAGATGATGGSGNAPSGKRSYSTSTRRRAELESTSSPAGGGDLPVSMQLSSSSSSADTSIAGHKFPLPALPLGPNAHKSHRYPPVIRQLTALMMRDGELSKAQTNMSRLLNHLRTSPAPNLSLQRPLLPGAPPASHLPLNPALYLQLAIDSVAPLIKTRQTAGLVGGGANVPVPMPLGLRQRRRQAFAWILEAASKKEGRGSGKGMWAQKVAEEVVAVVEGRSGVWEKRLAVHKLGTAARSNVGKKPRTRKGGK